MKDNKKLTLSIVLAVAVNIAAIFGWLFVFFEIQKSQKSILEAQAEIYQADRRLSNVGPLGALLKDTEKDKEKIESAFLNSQNLVGFIEKLESLGRKTETDVAVKSIKLPDQSEIKEPHFEIQVRGSFRDLFQYIFLLENLPYQISFERINLIKPEASKEAKKTSKNWEADLEISILSYAP